ncbi:hypothetical protein DPMN_163776 [Dreissena polymorpha]|uniref:Uncharacterized protein n=1 Tax=Dreissena polymorpha TaxID=45954 RepID=A0A9D4ESU5_DREPO|nr:hypothetical protein DPMN_163776 [Dreissena polymorpha]
MILYVLIQLLIGVIEGKAYEASATYMVFSPKVHVISPACLIQCGFSYIGLEIAAGMIVYDPPCSCQALSFDEFMTNGPIAYGNGNDIVGKMRNSVAYHPAVTIFFHTFYSIIYHS